MSGAQLASRAASSVGARRHWAPAAPAAARGGRGCGRSRADRRWSPPAAAARRSPAGQQYRGQRWLRPRDAEWDIGQQRGGGTALCRRVFSPPTALAACLGIRRRWRNCSVGRESRWTPCHRGRSRCRSAYVLSTSWGLPNGQSHRRRPFLSMRPASDSRRSSHHRRRIFCHSRKRL